MWSHYKVRVGLADESLPFVRPNRVAPSTVSTWNEESIGGRGAQFKAMPCHAVGGKHVVRPEFEVRFASLPR
jgi:hypothetical protein